MLDGERLVLRFRLEITVVFPLVMYCGCTVRRVIVDYVNVVSGLNQSHLLACGQALRSVRGGKQRALKLVLA